MTAIPAIMRLLPFVFIVCLGGCTSLLGGGERDRPTLYAPQPAIAIDPDWPRADISLLLAPPSAPPLIDSTRIVVRPHADEVEVLRGARWAQPPPELLQTLILRTLEDTGKLRAVAVQGRGITGDLALALDLRRFEADYRQGGAPTVEIAFTATLIQRREQQVLAARTFTHSERAQDTSTEATITAFSHGLAQLTSELAGWVLAAAARTDAASEQ